MIDITKYNQTGKMVFISESPEETVRLGQTLGELAKPGEVYALTGDLGVGKTALAQGFALGLGIEEPICSPTFTILQEYDAGRIPFYHFDVYRIADPSELDEIGFSEYLYGDGVCLVEWADLIPEELPGETVLITITKDPEKGYDYRNICIIRPERNIS